jgi:hypothetical protein
MYKQLHGRAARMKYVLADAGGLQMAAEALQPRCHYAPVYFASALLYAGAGAYCRRKLLPNT